MTKKTKSKLILVSGPTEKCPLCKKCHLVGRLTPVGFAFDCPNCQATFQEQNEQDDQEK